MNGMWRNYLTTCTAIAVLGIPTVGRAAVTVTKNSGGFLGPQYYAIIGHAEGDYSVVLLERYQAGGLGNTYEIRASAGESLRDVIVDIPTDPVLANGEPITVRILPAANSVMPLSVVVVGNSLNAAETQTTVSRIAVQQDIGVVDCWDVGDLEAGRDLIGPIIARTTSSGQGINKAQSARDILGDLIVPSGRIKFIDCGRHVGSASFPIVIAATSYCDQILATSGDVYADITSRYTGTTGYITRFECQRFFGSLDTAEVRVNSFISKGLIKVTNYFDASIVIGGSFVNSNREIELPAAGLRRQIIINGDATGGGAWTSPVKVGPTGNQVVLSSPTYSQTASSLGGGSVGLVPFRLHATDCLPVAGASVPRASAPAPGSPIRMRHYGPVAIPAGLGDPFIVERRSGAGTGSWTDETACFTQAIDGTNSTIVNLTPSTALQAGFQYRVRLATQSGANILRCDLPSGTATSVANHDSDYTFTVAPLCIGDADNDGDVDFADTTSALATSAPRRA